MLKNTKLFATKLIETEPNTKHTIKKQEVEKYNSECISKSQYIQNLMKSTSEQVILHSKKELNEIYKNFLNNESFKLLRRRKAFIKNESNIRKEEEFKILERDSWRIQLDEKHEPVIPKRFTKKQEKEDLLTLLAKRKRRNEIFIY